MCLSVANDTGWHEGTTRAIPEIRHATAWSGASVYLISGMGNAGVRKLASPRLLSSRRNDQQKA